jgi:DNA gyrase subunit A
VLPSAFPNFLVNGSTGIAVGMATNLASHNLGEVVDGICAQIDNPGITLPELMQYIKGPDFPVSCEVRGIRGIEEYFRTGRGSMRLRGKMEVEENANGRSLIIIREVPYGVNRATLQERIAELHNEKILTGISGMRDLSAEDTRIEIELKRDARPQVVVNQLFKLTQMETSFSVNMLAIHKNRPKQLSLKEAIDAYIEHRREVVIRRTRFLLGKAEERAELLEAYPWVTLMISFTSSVLRRTGMKPASASPPTISRSARPSNWGFSSAHKQQFRVTATSSASVRSMPSWN